MKNNVRNFRQTRQLDLFRELIVDNFAGGGGASTGIENALGQPVDIAINHDPQAITMHQANHPFTKHYCENVWEVDPREVVDGRPVGLVWLSPDCKHFSKAKGGKPVEKSIRGLAWVAIRWAATVKPRIIILENVEEFVTWGPLTTEGKPCPKNKGRTFRSFVNALKRQGYKVEWRELRACDFGAPTSRKRLFLIARCDGEPIVWPEPTHGDPKSEAVKSGKLKPWRTAAEIIDWSLPMTSIFERKKPLCDNTLRRIVFGLQKYVFNNPRPYIVTHNHSGPGFRGQSLGEPFKTITASRDAHSLITPVLVQCGWGERNGQNPRALDIEKPIGVTPAGGIKHAIGVATLIKNFGGKNTHPATDLDLPISVITANDHHYLALAYATRQFGTSRGASLDEPAGTVMPGGGGKTSLVAAFLTRYNGNPSKGEGANLNDALGAITSKDRFALIVINGNEYIITDILYRKLEPHELYAAQGFPQDYVIAPMLNGKPLTKTAQVRMVGNSVSPVLSEALVRANYKAFDIRSAKAGASR